MGTKEEFTEIAISQDEFNKWGCPHCGYRSVTTPISGQGAACAFCGECRKGFHILAEGISESPFSTAGKAPKLQEHPRKGIPKHGNPDLRPENGIGEFFRSRGLGFDYKLKCFCCGETAQGVLHNISGIVQCKDSGERIVEMLGDKKEGVFLDYRERMPDYVQVKIGACEQHKSNLEKLHYSVDDGIITEEKIKAAQAYCS